MQPKAQYGIALVACLALAFGAFFLKREPVAAEQPQSLSHATVDKRYVATLAPEAGDIRQGVLQAFVLTLKTPEGKPVEGATFVISGGMPAHGHGLPTDPQVTSYLGDGRYRVEGVKFSMTGLWELRFAISAPAGSDEAVFNLVL